MKKYLLPVAVLFTSLVQAQTGVKPEILARFNVLGLIDPFDRNFSTGVEVRFNPQWSAGTDAGYIFYSKYLMDAKRTSGFIVRPFIRHYYKKSKRSFVEAEFHYKMANYKLEDWLGREVVNGVPAYEELKEFTFRKQALGFHLKIGKVNTLSKNKKLLIEYYVGMGIRKKWNKSLEGDYRLREGLFSIHKTDPQYTGLAVPMGARLLYKIK